ncbi:MAG: methionine--tRNA ligase [bacterium]|nr:methionine--tRNA ligase [bacterium]
MSKAFYLTTAIDYVNALPHVGTAYEKIGADALARFKRIAGAETFFLMGVDEHSANVDRQARAQGMPPLAYCDMMSERFREVWGALGISFDRFIRTTEEAHVAAVQEVFRRIHDGGDIYRGSYRGWYCLSCEAFLKDADLVGGNCPSHGRRPEWIEEENYFFALSRYGEPLRRHIEENPGFIRPEIRRNEILRFLDEGLSDISVSRAGAGWGIRCPFDESQAVYVWFDALINYLSGAGFPGDPAALERRWPADVHIIGKDITRFHCLIWPAMLMAARLPLPRAVWGHGFVHLGGEKMSKTSGTAVDPVEIARRYGADSLRYFLLREVPFDRDGEFTMEKFRRRYAADLANDLGNLCQRTLVLVRNHLGGVLPAPGGEAADADGALRGALAAAAEASARDMEGMRFSAALERIWAAVGSCNRYVDEAAPWRLRKDRARAGRLAAVMYHLCESLRILSILIHPFMPATASAVRAQLGLPAAFPPGCLAEAAEFGLLPDGAPIGEVKPLFPKTD